MKVKLGEIAVLINGDRGKNYPSQADILEYSEMPFVNAGHLSNGAINFDEMNYISKEKYNSLNSGKFYKNDILYCLRGSLGKKALVREGIEGAIASSLVIIRPNTEKVDSEYLMFALDSPSIAEQLIKANNGSSQPNLSAASVRQYEFDLPDKKTQMAIVDRLLIVKNVVEARKQQLAKLDELVKARFVELFGDPVTNPMEWELHRFDSLCENLDSRRKPITASAREAGIYPYYGASGIVDYVADYLFDEDILLVSEDGANLLMRSTPIAFSVSGKVWVNNHAHVVRFEKKSMQKYIEVFFSLIDISDHITGSAQPKLNQAKLNAMMFPVPDEDRLESFLSFVEQTDKSKFAVQQSLDKLETLKKSLMQKYFG